MENKNEDFNNLNQEKNNTKMTNIHQPVRPIYPANTQKNAEEKKPFNYGRAPVDEGAGCSPKVASGCALALVIFCVIVFLLALASPLIIAFLTAFFNRFF